MSLILVFRELKLRYMKELISFLEKHVQKVIDDPDSIDKIVDKLFEDINFTYLVMLATSEALYFFQNKREEASLLITQGIEKLKEMLKNMGLDISEALEIIIEHDVYKIELILNNPEKFLEIFYYLIRYGEIKNYTKTYIASILLLYSLTETKQTEKLRKITEIPKKYVEELDAYTATFEHLTMKHTNEEQEIEEAAKTPEELKHILEMK